MRIISGQRAKFEKSMPFDWLFAVQEVTKGIKEKLREALDEIRTTAEELAYSALKIQNLS